MSDLVTGQFALHLKDDNEAQDKTNLSGIYQQPFALAVRTKIRFSLSFVVIPLENKTVGLLDEG